jgi:hypothetical protein
MELQTYDVTRLIHLTQVQRPAGQIYLPDAITKLVERYSFVKAPNADQALPYIFSVGKFQNTQINELGIYNDGLIISSASDTDFLEAFLNDLMSWSVQEFGLVPSPTAETYYESGIVVKS